MARRDLTSASPFARWAARRAERRALKEKLKARVDEVKRRPEVARAIARDKARRRRRQLAALIVILLLLLLRFDCTGDAGPAVVEAPTEEAPEPKKPEQKPAKKAKKPVALEGSVDASARDTMPIDDAAPPTWLAAFRLQAAARSPTLAACFVGTEKPGALRWSALVHARSGRVTESVVEPVFRGVSLSDAQVECLVRGLTDPPFSLDEPDARAPPRRVSLIFEF